METMKHQEFKVGDKVTTDFDRTTKGYVFEVAKVGPPKPGHCCQSNIMVVARCGGTTVDLDAAWFQPLT